MARLPLERVLDANGDPVNGGRAFAFLAGTTTTVAMYSDVARTNLMSTSGGDYYAVANSAGEFPDAYVQGGVYKIRYTDASDAVLYEQDNVAVFGGDGLTFATRAEAVASGTADASHIFVGGLAYEYDATGVALTTGDGRKWSPATGTKRTVLHYGAVADATESATAYPALTLKGGFLGTDAKAAIQTALTDSAGKTLHFPPGKYLIGREDGTTWSNTNILTVPSGGIEIVFDHGAEIWVDFDPNDTYSLCYLFGSPVSGDGTSLTVHEPVSVSGPGLIYSLWNYHPSGSGSTKMVNIWNFRQHKKVSFDGVRHYAIPALGSDCQNNNEVSMRNCTFERVASDCARFPNTPNVDISGNTFLHVADDCISTTIFSEQPDRRSQVIIRGNRLVDCEGILVLGARNTIIANNTLDRCKGTIIFAGFNNVNVADVGTFNIIIESNTVQNPLTAIADGGAGSTFETASFTNGAIIAGGNRNNAVSTTARVGAFDDTSGSEKVQQIAATDDDGNFIIDNFDADLKTLPPGVNITIRGNTVVRNLPPVTNYSDWNQGELFTASGFADPEVTASNFIPNGIGLVGAVWGAQIANNMIHGMKTGAAVFLNRALADADVAFRAISIADNMGVDCLWGFNHSEYTTSPAAPYNWDIHFEGNHWDLDPFVAHASRDTDGSSIIDGTWDTGATILSSPIGYVLTNLIGTTIRGGSVANCLYPIYAIGSGEVQNRVDHQDILVKCDPVAPGINAGNKGVGAPGHGSEYRHMIVDCDPQSANFGDIKNHCPDTVSGIPTSGTFVQGHIAKVRAPTGATWGWIRVTTGTGHVLDTDWYALS